MQQRGHPASSTTSVNLEADFATPLVTQTVKNLPAMWETWLQSPGQEGPLEEDIATRASFLAWRIPWTEEPGGLQSVGLRTVDGTE